MLILSRQVGERIVISDDSGMEIEIIVVRLDNKRVKLGIEAPDRIRVDRSEVRDSKDRELAEKEGE